VVFSHLINASFPDFPQKEKNEKSQILLSPFPPKDKKYKKDKIILSPFSRPFFLEIFVCIKFGLSKMAKLMKCQPL